MDVFGLVRADSFLRSCARCTRFVSGELPRLSPRHPFAHQKRAAGRGLQSVELIFTRTAAQPGLYLFFQLTTTPLRMWFAQQTAIPSLHFF